MTMHSVVATQLLRRLIVVTSCALLSAGTVSAANPMIWFAPMDPYTGSSIPSWVPAHGSTDYFGLFQEPSQWPSASGHVKVLKVYAVGLQSMTDAELHQLVSYTRSRGIRLALEIGMIDTASAGNCGHGVEGFGATAWAVQLCNRIASAGGELSYVAIDESFYNAAIAEGPQQCLWDAMTVASHVFDTVRAMRAVFPRLVVGDIEPVVLQPSATNPDVSAQVARYAAWFDAYRRVAGEALGFFHTDVNWWRTDWLDQLTAIRREVESRGIPFGIIYNGGSDMNSDAQWTAQAEKHFTAVELATCRPPDQAIFQSWDVYPKVALPETTASTFTNLIDRYLRVRTQIRWSSDGSTLSGNLWSSSGALLAGKAIVVTAQGVDRGIPYDFKLEGTVPDGATHMVAGLRLNTECAECSSSGSGTLLLYSVQYSENGGVNLVPNSDFSAGMNSWGIDGTAAAKVARSDSGSANALYVMANPGATARLNSIVINTTPGAHFTATFHASVPIAATMSGGFMVSFVNVKRIYSYFASPAVSIAEPVTDAHGVFSAPLTPPAGRTLYAAHFDGDDTYWPAANCSPRKRAVSH